MSEQKEVRFWIDADHRDTVTALLKELVISVHPSRIVSALIETRLRLEQEKQSQA